MACAHKFLSSVNNIIHISALHEQPHFTLAELQTKENLSNRNKTQPEKQSHDEKKKIENKLRQLHQKNINLSRYFWTWFISIVANLQQITTFSLITSTLIPPHYTLLAGGGGVLLSRSITIFQNIKTVLLVVPSSPLIHFRGWYSSRPAREERSQT